MRKDGSEFPVEISLSPVHSMGGMFVSSVIRDVTERKQMERRSSRRARRPSVRTRPTARSSAAASHDLRQPVQALSLLNGALRRTVTDERALQMIDSQQHSLTAMTNLLNSLLDISRLDAGAVTPDVEEFPIRRVIDRLSDEFARQAQHKGSNSRRRPCDAVVYSRPEPAGGDDPELRVQRDSLYRQGYRALECASEKWQLHHQGRRYGHRHRRRTRSRRSSASFTSARPAAPARKGSASVSRSSSACRICCRTTSVRRFAGRQGFDVQRIDAVVALKRAITEEITVDDSSARGGVGLVI